MEKRKITKTLVVSVITIIALCSLLYVSNKIKEKQQAKIEHLYSRQNFAFDMGVDTYYKSSSEVHKKFLIECLAAYEEDTQAYGSISVDDVLNYLSSEYNKNGELAVLNTPTNIQEYIKWYWEGGENFTQDYAMWLYNYQLDHLDKYGDGLVTLMPEEKIYEIIDDFKNCPDKNKYKYK